MGFSDRSECQLLGAMGDVLASSDFSSASVLIVQQFVGGGELEAESMLEGAKEEMVEDLQTPYRPMSAPRSMSATARSSYVSSPAKSLPNLNLTYSTPRPFFVWKQSEVSSPTNNTIKLKKQK